MATSIGDFSRYAKKPTSAIMQVIFFPGLWGFTSLLGAITSNMTLAIYGEIREWPLGITKVEPLTPIQSLHTVWQPFDVIDKWQGSRGGRAAAFFAAAAWALGNMGTNITANSISAANDATVLFPRWVNILRGQLFAVIIGVWAFAPWKVLGSAGSFISFMGGELSSDSTSNRIRG